MKLEPQQLAKLFLIICVIILTGTALGVIEYLAKNKPVKISQPQVTVTPTSTPLQISDNIADWETYRNEKYGFELKYPQNFLTSEKEEKISKISDKFGVFWIGFIDEKWGDVHNPAAYIYVIKTDFSAEEWVKKNYNPVIPDGDPGGYQDIKYANINGFPALQVRLIAASGSNDSILIKKDSKTLFRIDAHHSSWGNFPKEIFNKMLSTFKFTESFSRDYGVDSETKARVEIVSPKTMERNKANEVKLTISDWGNSLGLNLYQSFLSVQNITDYRLGDKVYSNCKENYGREECLISINPRCDWPNDVILYPIIRIATKSPDHIIDPFPNVKAEILTQNIEICDNQIDDNCDGKIDGIDSQCASFTIFVLPGEGITNLARRAILQFLEKFYSDSYLNKEQKIYAEDYMKKELKNKIGVLKVGQKIDFSVSLIEEAISEAKKLSFVQINYLNKYTGRVNYSAYRFVSKSGIVKDAESVWKIDDNTKNGLAKLYRFKDDGSESWKITEGSGSITVYYENKDINKIFYLIGAYRENIDAQDYDFIESLLSHSVQLSDDGINWEQGIVVYNNYYDKGNSGADKNGIGVGSFYIDVKNYNTGRLYIKFNLTSQTSGTAITLTKELKTNLD